MCNPCGYGRYPDVDCLQDPSPHSAEVIHEQVYDADGRL